MAGKKHLEEELNSQNINDSASKGGMDYNQIGQEEAPKTETIPKMTEEEQTALDEKRNDPKFQEELQSILPTENGGDTTAQMMDEAELNAKIASWQKDIDEVDPAQKVDNTGLPDKLKKNMEALSGISLDDVKVHYNSNKPAELNALAYTEGTDIYLGPGQEKHLAHEAWHVVQQKKGKVQPTTQLNGTNVNDDAGLESEADKMGSKALQTKVEPEVEPMKKNSKEKVTQMMAASKPGKRQVGGTCGINSLFMAISSFNNKITLQEVLNAADAVGTVVGEFMDAGELAKVAKNLGLTAKVISFNDEKEMRDKLIATGTDGTLMGYSVFGFKGYETDKDISELKHLFSHWSVIEAMSDTELDVRDPNNPGNISKVNITKFYEANQATESKNELFDFQQYEDKAGEKGEVADLKKDYNSQIDKSKHKDLPNPLPKRKLNLKGKILTVS